jgi:hypothetical protein
LIDSAKLLTTKAGMAKLQTQRTVLTFCPPLNKNTHARAAHDPRLQGSLLQASQQRPVAVLNVFCRQELLHQHQGRESLEDQGDAGDRFLQCAENSAPVKSSTGTRKQSPNGKPPAHNTLHQEMITLRQTLKTAPAPRMA